MLRLAEGRDVVLACGRTDLRKGIDGLREVVRHELGMDPFSGALYLFCGRRPDRIKGLVWEEVGFVLVQMRVEDGRFQWPRDAREARRIDGEQYERLLAGLCVEEKGLIRKVDGSTLA